MKFLPQTIVLFLLPLISHGVTQPRDFKGFVDILLGIMQTLVVLIFAITFITIIWKVVKSWIINGGDADGVEAGKQTVFVGIIALVIMSSIWGILYMLRSGIFGA